MVQHNSRRCCKIWLSSHYPAAMLNPMPVGTPRWLRRVTRDIRLLEVPAAPPSEKELLCPILPTLGWKRRFTLPRGVWRDTYFSEELKNAQRSNVNIPPYLKLITTRSYIFISKISTYPYMFVDGFKFMNIMFIITSPIISYLLYLYILVGLVIVIYDYKMWKDTLYIKGSFL